MKNKMKLFAKYLYMLSGVVVCSGLLTACAPTLTPPSPKIENIDISRYVAIGDSYLAGYMDNAWYRPAQSQSIPAIIAQQMGANFTQPLVPEGNGAGISPPLVFGGYFQMTEFEDCKGKAVVLPRMVGPADPQLLSGKHPDVASGFHNLAVPLAKSHDLQKSSLQFLNFFFRWFATDANSSVQSMLKQKPPTFFTMWAGAGDYLLYAVSGGLGSVSGTNLYDITPTDTFRTALNSLILDAKQNGAKGVISTLPSINVLPVFNTLPYDTLMLTTERAAELTARYNNAFNFQAGRNPLIVKDKSGLVRPIRATEKVLLNANDSIFCNDAGGGHPLTDEYFLEESELLAVTQAHKNFNTIIRELATQYDLGVVDMDAFFNSLTKTKYYEGIPFNNKFILGGFFSLDGIHPNPRGSALLANEFIRIINNKYNCSIPPADITRFKGVRFP